MEQAKARVKNKHKMEWDNKTNNKAKKYRIHRMGYEFKSCSLVCYHKRMGNIPHRWTKTSLSWWKKNTLDLYCIHENCFPHNLKILHKTLTVARNGRTEEACTFYVNINIKKLLYAETPQKSTGAWISVYLVLFCSTYVWLLKSDSFSITAA